MINLDVIEPMLRAAMRRGLSPVLSTEMAINLVDEIKRLQDKLEIELGQANAAIMLLEGESKRLREKLERIKVLSGEDYEDSPDVIVLDAIHSRACEALEPT